MQQSQAIKKLLSILLEIPLEKRPEILQDGEILELAGVSDDEIDYVEEIYHDELNAYKNSTLKVLINIAHENSFSFQSYTFLKVIEQAMQSLQQEDIELVAAYLMYCVIDNDAHRDMSLWDNVESVIECYTSDFDCEILAYKDVVIMLETAMKERGNL